MDIAFIGLGNMGGPMARNLVRAGHAVAAFDLSADALTRAEKDGARVATSARDAASSADAVITMLPAGPHVRRVFGGEDGLLTAARKGSLFIDCSTIDVESARHVAGEARAKGFGFVDAPVSGGVGGATAGTLTFMVGGSDDDFARAKPILVSMGQTIVHTGGPGTGQVAKICNNMLLGISMIGVSEAFVLAEKLGLSHEKLFEVSSNSSGQCWSLTKYCPVPGPVPASPANRDYAAGFTTAMMLKDLRLSQEAAGAAGAATPLGAEATALYALLAARGDQDLDFSSIIRMIRGETGRG
ncbi:MAG: 3-hydroxyisobutyrate dehydrogenase [Alphaproteobacteria bacterium]|nr:3-hydroxyisobutyrate dehydrogenase [Alphaproteobacteria bacterium]